KTSRAEFADLFSSTSYGLANSAVGSGVKVSNVAQQFAQGNIDPTGRSLDFAIDGEGFFTVRKNGDTMYTRAGNFQPDNRGFVVTPDGARLQVYAPNASGGFDVGRTTDLQLATTDSPPSQTGLVELMVTLPGAATEPTVQPFDPSESNSYNASSGGVTVYDSLGVSHVQTSYFVKTDTANQWEVYNFVDGTQVGEPTTMVFVSNGTLVEPADGRIAMDPFNPGNGAGVLEMNLDISGSTQYGNSFALRSLNQDGFASGKLTTIDVAEDGVVFARYTNGDDVALGQIVLTNFVNPQGLQAQGNNMWMATHASGTPRSGTPDSSDFGRIQSGALEASTVDLTEQLVNMITAQRNFQANAQMISTQDQATQTVINIRCSVTGHAR